MSKILTAYFSASGNTAKLANTVAKAAGADLFEIKAAQPYTQADLNWQDENSRSSIEMKKDKSIRPEIAEKLDNLSDYDVIFLGFPIWWYTAPTIINTFLESYDVSGKVIIPFATSGSSGMGDTNKDLATSAKGADLRDGKRFSPSESEAKLKDWIDSLEL